MILLTTTANHVNPVQLVLKQTMGILGRLVSSFLCYDCYYCHRAKDQAGKSGLDSLQINMDRFLSDFERTADLTAFGYPMSKLNDILCCSLLGLLSYPDYEGDNLFQKAEEIIDKNERNTRVIDYKKENDAISLED